MKPVRRSAGPWAALGRLTAWRPVRVRLTVLYSGLFLLAGAVLLAVTYGMVARGLDRGSPAPDPTSTPQLSQLDQICTSGRATANQVAKCKAASETFKSGVAAGVSSQRADALHQLLTYSLFALAAMVVVSAVLGWAVAGRALRPVHAITAAARRASEENLSERIGQSGPRDELKELADTFDAMLDRLQAAFTSQRRFVAHASHELRTPLTVMRTAIDVTLAKPSRTPAQLESMATEVRQAVEVAETLIEALLALARSDRGAVTREPLDLAVLAEDALDAAAPAITAAGLQPQAVLDPALTCGDSVLIERLVTNLIGNAVRHNAPGGWVQVATGVRAGAVFLDVANGGRLIPADQVPSLFEPFRRLDPEGAPGAGLGLSIVQSVAAAHHGRVSARPRAAGGLEISVLLPWEAGPSDSLPARRKP